MDIFSYLLGKRSGGGVEPPTLQSKEVSITENGNYNIVPDAGYDGLSDVSVSVSVDDLSDYFITHPTSVGQGWLASSFVTGNYPDVYIPETASNIYHIYNNWNDTKSPRLIFGNNITSLYQVCNNNTRLVNLDCTGWGSKNLNDMGETFQGSNKITSLDLSNLGSSENFEMYNAFATCSALTTINISGITTVKNISYAFYECSSLQRIDMRNMILTGVTNKTQAFSYVPNNCLIIVKDADQKSWLTTNFSNLTNVQTVEEYEASL